MFASEEAEAEARKESVKTFVPGDLPAPEVPKEEQAPKVVAPTPEQITAIKVLCLLRSMFLRSIFHTFLYLIYTFLFVLFYLMISYPILDDLKSFTSLNVMVPSP